MNAAEHIQCAKSEIARGGRADYATTHALIAIAELLAANTATEADGKTIGAHA